MIKLFCRAMMLSLAMMMVCPAESYAAMTDDQVVTYVKTGLAQGKSKEQIGKELLARGVTKEQVERLKTRYEQGDDTLTDEDVNGGEVRARVTTEDAVKETSSATVLDQVSDDAVSAGKNKRVFGQNVFRSKSLTFEPNDNLATPRDYILGPGDEVLIDIWGANEDHVRETISPEGTIMVSQIGPISLSGMTISQANNHIKNKFASKYAGVGGDNPDSDINVTLGNVRTIQVDIMGEVTVPGTYRLSPFSSVFHALYNAGGINDIGSLRNIRVLRNGKQYMLVDVYDNLFGGKQTGQTRLQEGDVIIVPPYEELVNIEGNVKRPMLYEMKKGETLDDLLKFAGGFTGNAYTEQVRVDRQSGRENELFNIVSGDFNTYQLQDGDAISVGTILDRYANRVEVKGSVFRPGMYALSTDLQTVGDVIAKADGLLEDAYTERALIYREGPDLSLEIIPVDIEGILSGRKADITLKRNDVLLIPSVHDLQDRGEVSIVGMVANPGNYPYADNMTVEDLIVQAGGLLRGASTAKVDVSRRIVDPTSLQPTNKIAKVFNFALQDGLVVKSDPDFILEPYDIVEIHRSPGYEIQQRVQVTGEVAFPGGYTLETRNERLSSIITRAGGIVPEAYVKGAHISRAMTDDEISTRNETLRLAGLMQSESDSISIPRLNLPTRYPIAINLEKALANPGSTYDIVMKDGDQIVVPEEVNTVKVSGEVMFPNTLTYVPGKKLKYYVNLAGGYGERAKKNKAFIVYMNGEVARVGRNVEIQPGCQVIIPSKHKGKGIDWTAVMAFTSGFATLGTMSAAIANLLKK